MEKMLDYIKKYPEMIVDAVELTKKARLPKYKFKKILVCGMGGSAICGDVLADLLRDRKNSLSVEVSRRYKLPPDAGRDALVVFVSYSGDTEETLSQFVEARKNGLRMICTASGGKLKKWCETFGVPFVELPAGFKPRAALPYTLFTVLEYLQESSKDLDFSKDIKEAVEVLEELRESDEKENEIKSMAGLIKDSRINVYGSEEFEAAVKRLKTQINESSKLPASWDLFPELDHNEIVGYEDNDLNRGDYVVILRDEESEKEQPEMRARIEASKEIIQSKVKGITEIWSSGKSKLAKEMSLIFLGDLLSYYLAIEGGKLPEKTDNIDKLKEVLKEELNTQEKLEKELV